MTLSPACRYYTFRKPYGGVYKLKATYKDRRKANYSVARRRARSALGKGRTIQRTIHRALCLFRDDHAAVCAQVFRERIDGIEYIHDHWAVHRWQRLRVVEELAQGCVEPLGNQVGIQGAVIDRGAKATAVLGCCVSLDGREPPGRAMSH